MTYDFAKSNSKDRFGEKRTTLPNVGNHLKNAGDCFVSGKRLQEIRLRLSL